jgi:hypothetical protein
MKLEQTYVIKFFVEEGIKGVEIIDRLDDYYGRDALQRMHTHYRIKELKSGRHDLSNTPPLGRTPDEGLDDCIGKALKENSHLSMRKIAKALNIGSTMVRNHLAKSLGKKYYHM